MMIAASILVGRALAPVQQLIGVWKSFSATRSAWERLTALLEANPARENGMSLPKPLGALAVENVTAAAPGSKVAVLKGLSFTVGAGDVLGVIGPSGSGKSTPTVVLITHRTSVIGIANKLLLLRDGMSDMFGPTDQVLGLLQQNAQKALQAQQAQEQRRQAGAPVAAPTATAGQEPACG